MDFLDELLRERLLLLAREGLTNLPSALDAFEAELTKPDGGAIGARVRLLDLPGWRLASVTGDADKFDHKLQPLIDAWRTVFDGQRALEPPLQPVREDSGVRAPAPTASELEREAPAPAARPKAELVATPQAWDELSPEERKLLAQRFASEAAATARLMASLRQKLTPEEEAGQHVGFSNETLDAAHYFSLSDLDPMKATMLLCGYNPEKVAAHLARESTNDGVTKDDFRRLLQRFEDLAKCEPKHRSLLQWLQFARASNLRYHPWIDEYVEAAGLNADGPAAAEPVPSLVAEDAAAEGQSVVPLSTETAKERRARLLDWFEDEVARSRRGALARLFAREKARRPTADRSNIGKDLRKARADRAEEVRAGALLGPLGR